MATNKVRTENQRSIDRLYMFAQWLKENGRVKSLAQFEISSGVAKNYLINTLQSPKGSVGADILRSIYLAYPYINIAWVVTGMGKMISDDENKVKEMENKVKEMELIMMRCESILTIIDNISTQTLSFRDDIALLDKMIKEVKLDMARTQNDTANRKSKDK
jgi:hypothetical protein